MAVPYTLLFLPLLGAYMVYSEWARLDSRYPIGAALLLLVATAVTDAAGAVAAADTLAEYVFFLLAAGVVLLLVDHVRSDRAQAQAGSDGRPAPAGPAGHSADERDPVSDQALDRPEQ